MPEVFISYAHADDAVMVDGGTGWVTTFAGLLQKQVNMKPGGSGTRVWMDHRLEPQRQLDSALADNVAKADCFVALMSPRYLQSDWCRSEIDGFIARRGGTATDRVFIIETLPTDRGAWPTGTGSLVGFPFWTQEFDQAAPMRQGEPVPQPRHIAYWQKLNELAHMLAAQLGSASAPSAAPMTGRRRRVWIADPTDHVLDHWDALAAAVRQQGAEVMPAVGGQYPLADEAAFQSALAADLERADLLVQLLGPHPGRKPLWAASPLSRLQAEAAQACAARRGLPYIAWRAPDVARDAIGDEDHRRLVTGSSACSIAELQAKVIARLAAPAPAAADATNAGTAPGDGAPLTICVNADSPDRDLGERVRDLLFDEFDVDVNLAAPPLPDQLPAHWRQNYETQLQHSHGLVIVYGQTPPSWVQAEVQAAKKVLARPGIWGAVLDGAPPARPDHGVRSRSLMAIDCRAGLARESLARFVDTLRHGPGLTAGAADGG